MGLTKFNQENEGVTVGNGTPVKKGVNKTLGKSMASSQSQQKSLIPVPKTLSTPKGDENLASPKVDLTQKIRRPLSSMQNVESPSIQKSTGKLALKKSENIGTPVKVTTVEKSSGTDGESSRLPAGVQLHRNFPGTPHNSPNKSKLKTRKSNVAGSSKNLKSKTAEEKAEESQTIAYWKELAESRRQALDAALQENYELHKRVEELEKDNAHLEEIVKEAENLAEMVNSAADKEDLELDESGIVDSNMGTSV